MNFVASFGKLVAWALVGALLWPSTALAADAVMAVLEQHVQMVMPGDKVPFAGVLIPEPQAKQIVTDLQHYEILKGKYFLILQERDVLVQEVAQLKIAERKASTALDVSEKLDTTRQEMVTQLQQAIELNSTVLKNASMTMESQLAFMKAQQAEIDSMRSERKWLMIFGGLASLAFGAMLFFK